MHRHISLLRIMVSHPRKRGQAQLVYSSYLETRRPSVSNEIFKSDKNYILFEKLLEKTVEETARSHGQKK